MRPDPSLTPAPGALTSSGAGSGTQIPPGSPGTPPSPRFGSIASRLRALAHAPWACGAVLITFVVLALFLANTPSTRAAYHSLHIIERLVNDGLMALFFFVVGLEIKRELTYGELSSPRQALLPIVGAVGGMVVPAAIYAFFNAGTPFSAGWGIPMATDIAFAIAVLSLLGRRVPSSLKIFLTALAIVDDLGAIIVIAVFYTHTLSWLCLALTGVLIVALWLLRRARITFLVPYIIVGLALWYCLFRSGVHATIAGVILAMFIPAKRLEQQLHPWVTFLVLPLFALCNAGVEFSSGAHNIFASSYGAGIFSGLVIGKPLGIFAASWLAVVFRIAVLPRGVRWLPLFGVVCMGGIGFTMSIFIDTLAFAGDKFTIDSAKIAILVASVCSALLGLVILGCFEWFRSAHRVRLKNRQR